MRTIKELIEVLQTFPEDLPIYVHGVESTKAPEVFTIDFRPDFSGYGYVVLEGATNNPNPKDDNGKDIQWEQ